MNCVKPAKMRSKALEDKEKNENLTSFNDKKIPLSCIKSTDV